MAAKSDTGMEIDLDLVQREEGMNPYEIMLSRSQGKNAPSSPSQDKVKPLQAVFSKWDLEAVVIGKVTDDGQLKAHFHGELVIDIPVKAVVDLCPAYRRPVEAPAFVRRLARYKIPEMPADLDLNQVFLQLNGGFSRYCRQAMGFPPI